MNWLILPEDFLPFEQIHAKLNLELNSEFNFFIKMFYSGFFICLIFIKKGLLITFSINFIFFNFLITFFQKIIEKYNYKIYNK